MSSSRTVKPRQPTDRTGKAIKLLKARSGAAKAKAFMSHFVSSANFYGFLAPGRLGFALPKRGFIKMDFAQKSSLHSLYALCPFGLLMNGMMK